MNVNRESLIVKPDLGWGGIFPRLSVKHLRLWTPQKIQGHKPL